MGTSSMVVLMVGCGVLFTSLSVIAWVRRAHTGSMVLAVLAGIDFAFALAVHSGAFRI